MTTKQELHINIFRKDPVQELWEVSAEVCCGERIGQKFKIYVDNQLAEKLKRGNEFVIKLNKVNRFFVEIYKTVRGASNHCSKFLPSDTTAIPI